jgi:hypothetical protein
MIRCNAGEKITSIFELFTKQKIGFRFVLFLSVQTLLTYFVIHMKETILLNGFIEINLNHVHLSQH